MTQYTPNRGIPYPEGSDQVAVHDDVRALAMKTDAELVNVSNEAAQSLGQAVDAFNARDLIEGRLALGDSHLDTVLEPGQYTQTNSAYASADNGYPGPGTTGVLEVISLSANVVLQRLSYTSTHYSGLLYQRRISSAVPGPWRQVGWSSDTLTTQHLDTVIMPGAYHQDTASNATLDRGYPVERAQGLLEVMPLNSSETVMLQRFTAQSTRDVYTRLVATGITSWKKEEKAELISIGISHLDTILEPGRYFQANGGNVTPDNGYPVQRVGFLEVFTVGPSVVQRYTTTNINAIDMYQRLYNGTSWSAWVTINQGSGNGGGSAPVDLPAAVKPLTQWAPRRLQTDLIPRGVGRDGRVYGVTEYSEHTIFRSDDALRTTQEGPNLSAQLTGFRILSVLQTEAGYTVIGAAGSLGSDESRILFSADPWGPDMIFEEKWQGRSMHVLTCPQPVIDPDTNQTVLLAGEYATPQRREARSLVGSFDGGQTWATLYTSPEGDPNSTDNMHFHTATYDTVKKAIWASFGDGVNARFGYSEDRGNTWTWIEQDPGPWHPGGDRTAVQPTILISFDEVIASAPDGGSGAPTGIWEIDRDTGQTVATLYGIEGRLPAQQYGAGPIARDGNRAYVPFPATLGDWDDTIVLGTGDGGHTWHEVYRYERENGTYIARQGILGPDRHGNLYMPLIAAGTWYCLVGAAPRWVVTDDPQEPLPRAGKTSDRPPVQNVPAGHAYFDHDLASTVWASTHEWVDVTNNPA